MGEEIKALEQEVAGLEERIRGILMGLPNIPLEDVPDGLTEEGNVPVRSWGEPASFDFDPRPHWDLGPELGIIDFQAGVKLAGPRSFVLTGQGARLERALINWMLDLHTGEHGYVEMHVPALVKREMLEGSGNLPKFADNLYHDEEDDAWLIPTAEVPLTNLHRDEVLAADALPLYYNGVHAVLPAGEGGGGTGHPGHKAGAAVRQGGDVQVRGAGEVGRGAGDAAGRRRGRVPAAGAALPGAEAVRGGDGVRVGQVLRHRDVGARGAGSGWR